MKMISLNEPIRGDGFQHYLRLYKKYKHLTTLLFEDKP